MDGKIQAVRKILSLCRVAQESTSNAAKVWCRDMTREVRCPKREATEAVLAGAEAKSLCSNHVPLKERKKTALGKISIPLVAEVQEVVTSAAG